MVRFILFVLSPLSVLFVLPGTSVAESDNTSYTALKFAYDESSLISFNPDMNPLTEKFSVCLWIRKLQSGISRSPFTYNGNTLEIFMTDSGYYNMLFGSSSLDNTLTSKFTTPMKTWFSYCSTWSLSSRTFRVYVNGQLVGTQTTSSGRRLQTGHTLILGNMYSGSGYRFGGEMYNFNMFSKELTATEVATMSTIGLCTEIPEQLEEYRVIKWEEILKLSRSGTVQDKDTKCAPIVELQSRLKEVENGAMVTQRKLEVAVTEKSSLELSLNKTQTELLKVQALFNSTQEELVGVRGELGTTEGKLGTTEGELNETRIELEDTKLELEDTKLDLKNVSESRCALLKGNLTKWDIFYSPTYYNKTFTRRLYQELRATWDSISSRLFGMMITDRLIELIKDLDDEQIESCGDLS